MPISEKAKETHDELFPNYQSSLGVTDPELVEVFGNFAFDEVLAYGNLDHRTRMMVILASLIASQALGEFKIMLTGALNIGVTPIEVKEVVYQAVPYVGIGKTYEFIYATNEILESRGVKLPLEGQSTSNPETRRQRGLEVTNEIFGPVLENMKENSPENQKHFADYLAGNCFGDFVVRNGVDLKTRELLTFSMLMSLGGCESQLKGHTQGNLNVGNDKETLLSVITQLLPYVGYPRTLNALAVLNEVVPEEKE